MQVPELDSPVSSANHRFRRIAGEFLRFLVMGGVNTIAAYLVYLLLLHWLRYEWAYTIGYAVGIAMAYVLSATFVFRTRMQKRSATRFPFIYLAQFLVSLGLLKFAVEIIQIEPWLALGFAVILTIPVTFLLSRWVLHAS